MGTLGDFYCTGLVINREKGWCKEKGWGFLSQSLFIPLITLHNVHPTYSIQLVFSRLRFA